ncbi:ERG2 family protein [Mycobacterium avium]|uniref:ERG2 family protein n=1 Tax=Mycobacterium avium TaxID=1764 RepID=UPI000CE35215|nr:ERG2 family protein [Mycobacterium avium]
MGPIFDADNLHAIAKSAVGMETKEAAFAHILHELNGDYRGHIRDDVPWVFNNAGGAMGQMKLLHASLSEYLIFFGTPIGTEGHSGRYGSEVWDFIIDGEVWCYEEGQFERSVYQPGDVAYLAGGRAKGYAIPDSAFMLEYARGPIPAMMPFGIGDAIFSTLDAPTIGKTALYYTRLVVGELLKGKV